MSWLRLSTLASTLAVVAACVTINVYFPAAAAEKTADRIIDEVWGAEGAPPAKPVPKPTSSIAGRTLVALLELVVPAAQAQEPNFDASSPEIDRLKSQMENRYAELKPYFDSGAVGLGNDGFVELHDASLVPLSARNTVRTQVANENSDRAALYREIAVANKQPQWEGDIRSVFAQRWIAKAKTGWWHKDANGAWKQK
ncbi:MAG TPA: DUF1318 domain-containing protein [Solimonas sp.]|nr:DUF1318 domain-containing protein [Solimonas sp.]